MRYDKSKRNGVGHIFYRIGGLTDASRGLLGYTWVWLYLTTVIRSREDSYGVPAGISAGADAHCISICSVAARRRAYNRETLIG